MVNLHKHYQVVCAGGFNFFFDSQLEAYSGYPDIKSIYKVRSVMFGG